MLYINGRFLTQPMTGVNRFSYELTKALSEEGYDFTIICPKQDLSKDYDISGFNIVKYGFGKSHIWEIFSLPLFFIDKKENFLISFSGLGPVGVKNKITTIHDVAHLVNPQWYSLLYRLFYRLFEPLVLKSCKRIITVSEFSKSEILKHYNFICPDDIHVIYNACNKEWTVPADSTIATSDYILCVSSIDPRKNFPILLKAFKEMPDVNLKIVGGKNAVFENQMLDIPRNVEFLGRVTDEELAHLYSNAIAFIYPTLYEGFGLPPIEASHFGCPILVSDIPVLKEVCGDSAIYFNPYSHESIIDAVHTIIFMPEEQRRVLINAGMNNLVRFSWKISAERLVLLLKNLKIY